MGINVIEDVLMTGGFSTMLIVVALTIFSAGIDARVDQAREKSALHNKVITEYKDVCLKTKKKSECIEDEVSTAIAEGYQNRAEQVFIDAHIYLTDEQKQRLKQRL